MLLSCRNFLCILDVHTLPDLWFENIFSQSMGCLFILLFPLLCRTFLFRYSLTCLFLLLLSGLKSYLQKNNCQDQCHKRSPLCVPTGMWKDHIPNITVYQGNVKQSHNEISHRLVKMVIIKNSKGQVLARMWRIWNYYTLLLNVKWCIR